MNEYGKTSEFSEVSGTSLFLNIRIFIVLRKTAASLLFYATLPSPEVILVLKNLI